MDGHDPTALPPLSDNTRLAIERTQLAHDRTLMAWIRTATSLISFGFTIYKFFQDVQKGVKESQVDQWLGHRGFALLMITIGLFCLLIATVQDRRDRKSLATRYHVESHSLVPVIAALIFALGIFGFVIVILRQ